MTDRMVNLIHNVLGAKMSIASQSGFGTGKPHQYRFFPYTGNLYDSFNTSGALFTAHSMAEAEAFLAGYQAARDRLGY